MKTLFLIASGCLLIVATGKVSLAASTIVYSQDFENGPGETAVVAGPLVGQDGWTNYSDGTHIQIGIGTGDHTGGNAGTLDNMQILPTPDLPGISYCVAYRPFAALNPTQTYTLTFDACSFEGLFGFGDATGHYQAAIVFDSQDELAFDTRHLLNVSDPDGYDLFPFPSGEREKFKIVVDGPNSTISAYENDGNGLGYSLISTQQPTATQIANIASLSLWHLVAGSDHGFGIDNIQLYSGTLPLEGDFNLDGHVNAADILAMERALVDPNGYKTANSLSNLDYTLIGDINQDGIVNSADLQTFLNFLVSGGGSTHSVPEPSSLILLALGACGILIQQRSIMNKG